MKKVESATKKNALFDTFVYIYFCSATDNNIIKWCGIIRAPTTQVHAHKYYYNLCCIFASKMVFACELVLGHVWFFFSLTILSISPAHHSTLYKYASVNVCECEYLSLFSCTKWINGIICVVAFIKYFHFTHNTYTYIWTIHRHTYVWILVLRQTINYSCAALCLFLFYKLYVLWYTISQNLFSFVWEHLFFLPVSLHSLHRFLLLLAEQCN